MRKCARSGTTTTVTVVHIIIQLFIYEYSTFETWSCGGKTGLAYIYVVYTCLELSDRFGDVKNRFLTKFYIDIDI